MRCRQGGRRSSMRQTLLGAGHVARGFHAEPGEDSLIRAMLALDVAPESCRARQSREPDRAAVRQNLAIDCPLAARADRSPGRWPHVGWRLCQDPLRQWTGVFSR